MNALPGHPWTTTIGVLAVAVSALACSAERDEYLERLGTWRSDGPHDYTWTLEATEPVFGPKQAEIRVRNGRAVAIEGDVAPGAPVTVEGLLVYLITAEDDANSVHVVWDGSGYPAQVGIDHSDAIDDEVRYRVLAFTAD